MKRLLVIWNVAVTTLLLLGAAKDADVLKVKEIEAELITVKDPNAGSRVSISAGKDVVGVWVTGDPSWDDKFGVTPFAVMGVWRQDGPVMELRSSSLRTVVSARNRSTEK